MGDDVDGGKLEVCTMSVVNSHFIIVFSFISIRSSESNCECVVPSEEFAIEFTQQSYQSLSAIETI